MRSQVPGPENHFIIAKIKTNNHGQQTNLLLIPVNQVAYSIPKAGRVRALKGQLSHLCAAHYHQGTPEIILCLYGLMSMLKHLLQTSTIQMRVFFFFLNAIISFLRRSNLLFLHKYFTQPAQSVTSCETWASQLHSKGASRSVVTLQY